MANIFEIEDYPPFANLIICGEAQTGIARLAFDQEDLPAFQALLPGAEPSAGLPCIRITLPSALATDIPAARLSPMPASPADNNLQTLEEVLADIEWVTLVIGDAPESLAIALVIARHAKSKGNVVTVLEKGADLQPPELRQLLLDQVDLLCSIPADLSVLDAAQALWSSLNAPSEICVGYDDFQSVRGTGAGQLLWRPLADSGVDCMNDTMDRMPAFFAKKWLWGVLVIPECMGLEQYTIVADHVSAFCSDEAMVAFSCPIVRGLPYGIYLFFA